MQQKCSPCTHLKPFFNLPLAFESQLYWASPWIVTGETPMISRIELTFFFGDSYSKKLSTDANSSCQLCLNEFCHTLIFRWFS